MPGERGAALAAGTRTGVADQPLRAHRIHAAAGTLLSCSPALKKNRVHYTLLSHASSTPLLDISRVPRHLGAAIGFFSVLHTWNQRLEHHPHVHCVAAAGGLAPDPTPWIASQCSFFLPIKVLSRVFRG